MNRDFDKNPYSPDEERVAKWLDDKAGVGGGEDPIGFLIASYAYIMHMNKELQRELDHGKSDRR